MDEFKIFLEKPLLTFQKLFLKAFLLAVLIEVVPLLLGLIITIPIMFLLDHSDLASNVSIGLSLVIIMPIMMVLMASQWGLIYQEQDGLDLKLRSVIKRGKSIAVPFTFSMLLISLYVVLTAIPGGVLLVYTESPLLHGLAYFILAVPIAFLLFKFGYTPIIATSTQLGVFDAVDASAKLMKQESLAQKLFVMVATLLLIGGAINMQLESVLGEKGLISTIPQAFVSTIFSFLSIVLMIRLWGEKGHLIINEETTDQSGVDGTAN